jgi:SAM-dependent methyltransferase
MPPALVGPLRDELTERGLFEETCGPARSEKELIGGEGVEDARKHFAHRFTTSSARVEFVVLGPGKNFEPTSTDLLSFFKDGRVTVLDLPCGSGGGLFGMLCTIAELRSRHALPRLPVDLHVHAADISPEAMAIHRAMLARVRAPLADVGIRLTEEYSEWDVTDDYSTARLMDTWLTRSSGCEAYLVFVSAFGGFAQDHFTSVQTAIRDILVRFHDDRQILVVWIEPAMRANTRWFPKLTELFTRLFRGRGEARGHGPEVKFQWRHPFTAASISGSVQLISCDKLNR